MEFHESRDALEKYIIKNYINDPNMGASDMKCGIRDLITDLLHVCDKHECFIEERLAGAREVYEEEIESELRYKTGQM